MSGPGPAAQERAARPLVLLPGLMCDERLFHPLAERLEGWDVLAPAPHRAATVEGLAREALAAVEARIGAAPFVLGGLSMGGIVALALARLVPERVEALVLMDTNHLAETPERRAEREPQIARARADLRAVLIEELKPAYLGPRHREDAALLDLVLDMGMRLGPDAFERQSLALRDRPDASDVVARFPKPLLALCGAHDAVCPPERHRAIATLAPRGRFALVPGAGHLPTLEEPDETAAALRPFLAALPAPSRPAGPSRRPATSLPAPA